jgi:endonuclease/exonuclease/phosphatase family metal-dependent hydrolase
VKFFPASCVLVFTFVLAFTFSPTPGASLRIASFNLEWLTATATETRMAPWKNEADLAAHRRDLARILSQDVRADILCVLEVTSRAALDKLAAEPALKKSGYRVLHLESGDTGTGQDVAFLVRVPVDKIDGLEIRRFADTLSGRPGKMRRNDARRQRLTKHAVVCFSAPAKLCVLGVHLLAHPDDKGRTRKRETQARIIAQIIRDEIVRRGYAPVVVGDFNDFDPAVTPDSGQDRRVLRFVKDFDPRRIGPELFNAAERIPEAERYSAWWDRNKNGKRDSTDPVSLLDHILIDNVLSKRIGKAGILHGSHDGSVSDHWPVVVELR